ncbi:hypothetical protein QFC21_002642 [Naganishia friedmannii]|uniref:Uncharacterized protein n=1 Tax=Naganishia friedmannii TaxID=89922 RepID=A0ACC2VVX9_9TREE|nr:hypothetical protein QFC21_002642 [Naganishia friedmannii]
MMQMKMESPLLPTYTTRRQPKAKHAPTTFIFVLVGMTIVNFVNFANPGFSSSCLHAVHNKITGWQSYSAIATQFFKGGRWSSPENFKVDDVYKSLGQPKSSLKPDIDVPEAFDPSAYFIADSSSRRMTGEPGIDFWDQGDIDEDLETIFSRKEFVAQGSVRPDWHEVAAALEFFTLVQDDTAELSGEAQAIWQFLLGRSSSTAEDEDHT